MAKSKETVATSINYALENPKLEAQLTKRNEQYIFDLDKALVAANIGQDQRDSLKYSMMQELIEGQKKGQTARQLFGTVSQQVQLILEGPQEDKSQPSNNWLLFLDGGLILGSLFMIISGFVGNQAGSQPQGLTSLLFNYVFAGAAMLVITKASPRYRGENSFPNWQAMLKYALLVMVGMIIWMAGMIVVTFIPQAINPVLPGIYYILIGAATVALRFYLKKQLDIRGTIF